MTDEVIHCTSSDMTWFPTYFFTSQIAYRHTNGHIFQVFQKTKNGTKHGVFNFFRQKKYILSKNAYILSMTTNI